MEGEIELIDPEKLRVVQWGKGREGPLTFLAQTMVGMAEPLFEILNATRDPSNPILCEIDRNKLWWGEYYDNKWRLFADAYLAAVEYQKLETADIEAGQESFNALAEYWKSVINGKEPAQILGVIIEEAISHLPLINDFINATGAQPFPNDFRDVEEMPDWWKNSAPQFMLRVWLPCLIEFQEFADEMYLKACKGDVDSLVRIIKLDNHIIRDSEILNRYLQIVDNGPTAARNRIINAQRQGLPALDISNFKQMVSGLLLAIADALANVPKNLAVHGIRIEKSQIEQFFNVPTYPDLYRLWGAAAADRCLDEADDWDNHVDPTLNPNFSAFERTVRKYRRLFYAFFGRKKFFPTFPGQMGQE